MWWEYKLVKPLWKMVLRFLKKIKIELPYDSAILLLGIYPKKMKTLTQKDTHPPMFTAALFTSQEWKQPKWLSTDEWVKKMWGARTHTHTHTHTHTPLSCQKGHLALRDDMDGAGRRYVTWRKSETDRQMQYNVTGGTLKNQPTDTEHRLVGGRVGRRRWVGWGGPKTSLQL